MGRLLQSLFQSGYTGLCSGKVEFGLSNVQLWNQAGLEPFGGQQQRRLLPLDIFLCKLNPGLKRAQLHIVYRHVGVQYD